MTHHPARTTTVTGRRGGRAWTSAPELPADRRGPRVAGRAVACPDCLADVDEPCVNADGQPRSDGAGYHYSRRRLAVRKHNADRAAAAAELPAAPEKVGGKGAGPVACCPSCAAPVRLVQAKPALHPGARHGQLAIPNHAPGGGRRSRGEPTCFAAGQIFDPEDEA